MVDSYIKVIVPCEWWIGMSSKKVLMPGGLVCQYNGTSVMGLAYNGTSDWWIGISKLNGFRTNVVICQGSWTGGLVCHGERVFWLVDWYVNEKCPSDWWIDI